VENKKEIVKVSKQGSNIFYHTYDINSYFGINGMGMSDGAIKGEKALTHSFVVDVLRKIMGKTLTVIDSSITDTKQNKAMKDLVRNIISDELQFSAEMAFEQKILQEQAEEYFKDIPDEELEKHSVSLEEALGVDTH